jgi:hypothetical protein
MEPGGRFGGKKVQNRNRPPRFGGKKVQIIENRKWPIRHSTFDIRPIRQFFRQNNINITMNTANPPPSSGAAIACSILVILFSFLLVYQREHLRNAIRSRLARRELAKKLLLSDGSVSSLSSSSTDGKGVEGAGPNEDGPVVTGIFIHPGKRYSSSD